MNILAVDHIGIRVYDLHTSRKFYEQFGFEFIAGPVGPEPVAIMKHPCGIVINFILNADSVTNSNILMDVDAYHAGYTHVALTVDDLASTEKMINELGIVITEGPINFGENMGSSLFIRDPDRNVIEFHSKASHS